MEALKQAILSNIFMLIVVIIYSVFIGKHFVRRKKYSGKQIKKFKHRSATRTMGYIMAFFGVFYCVLFIMDKNKKDLATIFTFLLFIYFVIIVTLSSIQDIIMYENGLYYSGKFALYADMASITKIGKNGIQIKLNKKGMGDSLYMSKVENEKELIALVKKNIKLAKKYKKTQERLEKQQKKIKEAK